MRALLARAIWYCRHHPSGVLVLGLLALSAYATFTGFAARLDVMGSVGGLLACAALTVLLQWAFHLSVGAAKGQTGRRRLGSVVILIGCMTVSVSFGYAFYWEKLSSWGEASRSYQAHAEEVLGYLSRFEASYGELVGLLDQLAAHSREMKEIEATRGGSCGASPRGEGPIMRQRRSDAAWFGSLAVLFASKQERAVQALDDFRAAREDVSVETWAVNRAATRAALREALALHRDPTLEETRRRLRERVQGVGGSVPCNDPLIASLGSAVLAVELEAPPDGLEIFDPADQADRLRAGFDRLLVLAGHLFRLTDLRPASPDELRARRRARMRGEGHDRAGSSERVQSGDVIPLVLALMVDVLIIWFSEAQRPRARSGLAAGSGWDEARGRELRTLLQALDAAILDTDAPGRRLVDLLQRRRYSVGARDYVWHPDPARGRDRALADWCAYLVHAGLAREAGQWKASDIARQAPHDAALSSFGGWVRVYRISRGLVASLTGEIVAASVFSDSNGRRGDHASEPTIRAVRNSRG